MKPEVEQARLEAIRRRLSAEDEEQVRAYHDAMVDEMRKRERERSERRG